MKGKQDRNDDARELYTKAANCFKLAQDYKNALDCYMECIRCEEDESDCAPHYRDAANCVKDSDLDKYVELTKKAIDLYSLSGRASTGAGMAKECAMLLEENYDYESAIDLFSKAAHLYEMDNQNT